MTAGESHQADDFSRDPYFHSIPQQPHNDAPQNPWVPPAPANGQPEDHHEGIPPPVGGVAGPGGVQDPPCIDAAYRGRVDYRPQPLGNPAYIFPDMGQAQGIPAQVQPNAPDNQERNPFGYVPQQVALGPVQAPFPQPFAYQIPPYPPGQARAGNLRQFVGRCFYHPDAQLNTVMMHPATPGRNKVVVIFETPDDF